MNKNTWLCLYVKVALWSNHLDLQIWWASPKNSEPQPETKALIVSYSEETTEKINLARHKSKTDPAIWIFCMICINHLELNVAGEGLAKTPIGRYNIKSCDDLSIAGLHSEGQALTIVITKTLPVDTPISWHGFPLVRIRPFDPNIWDISSSPYVRYEH